MPFLTISNESTFLKTQGSRLGAIVAPNKGLEQALNILGFVLISFGFKSLLESSFDVLAVIEVNLEDSMDQKSAEAYSEPCHSSKMERFAKAVVDYFRKTLHLDVSQGSEYAIDQCFSAIVLEGLYYTKA